MITMNTTTNDGLITATTYGVHSYTRFSVHTRTRYGVYSFVGAFATRKEAHHALAAEVRKGYIAGAWIRFEDGEKLRDWDHDHDTVNDADKWAEAYC